MTPPSSDKEMIEAIMKTTGAKTAKEAMMKLMTMPQAEQTKLLGDAMAKSSTGGPFEMIMQLLSQKPEDTPLQELRGEHVEDFCNGCGGASNSGESFLNCSACHCVKYCSKDCQRKDWTGHGVGGVSKGRKHKEMCKEIVEIKEEFEQHPTAGKVLVKDLFSSWADQHHPKNDAFFLIEFLARKNMLGNDEKVGYWAIPNVLGTWHDSGPDPSGFLNGSMMLKPQFPSAKEGWTATLRPNEYPDVTVAPGKAVPEKGIFSWKDYLEFRDLAPTTMMPLIFTNTLSVYYMIHHQLKMTAANKPLKVDLLGVEVELNQIPLFEELAHLLPKGTDLTLTLISKGTREICDESKKVEFKDSIIATATDHVVLDATHGDSRIRVRLCADHALYQDVPDEAAGDAVLALNAELASYPEWPAAVHKALRLGVPMCVTDTSRITARHMETMWLPQALKNPPVTTLEVETVLNPFHGIVKRDIAAVRLPDMRNGYITTIQAGEEGED